MAKKLVRPDIVINLQKDSAKAERLGQYPSLSVMFRNGSGEVISDWYAFGNLSQLHITAATNAVLEYVTLADQVPVGIVSLTPTRHQYDNNHEDYLSGARGWVLPSAFSPLPKAGERRWGPWQCSLDGKPVQVELPTKWVGEKGKKVQVYTALPEDMWMRIATTIGSYALDAGHLDSQGNSPGRLKAMYRAYLLKGVSFKNIPTSAYPDKWLDDGTRQYNWRNQNFAKLMVAYEQAVAEDRLEEFVANLRKARLEKRDWWNFVREMKSLDVEDIMTFDDARKITETRRNEGIDATKDVGVKLIIVAEGKAVPTDITKIRPGVYQRGTVDANGAETWGGKLSIYGSKAYGPLSRFALGTEGAALKLVELF